jgi:hypothetical protein
MIDWQRNRLLTGSMRPALVRISIISADYIYYPSLGCNVSFTRWLLTPLFGYSVQTFREDHLRKSEIDYRLLSYWLLI